MLQLRHGSGSDGKESACNVGDPGSAPGSGRSPGEGNGNPLQYSFPENSMDSQIINIKKKKKKGESAHYESKPERKKSNLPQKET